MSSDKISRTRRAFKLLHQSGCFVLPNPWDAGSASLLESLGFKALATTSSGYAWSLSRPDGGLNRIQTLETYALHGGRYRPSCECGL